VSIVDIAHYWIDTPYHHQAKLKGVGVDCAMLIAGIAEEFFDTTINTPVYSPEWHLHNKQEMMLEILDSFNCVPKELYKREPGDIITFRFGRVQSHLGILVENNEFIHARLDIGKVVKNQLSGEWTRRLGFCYKFPTTL
jgi:NlpC/P60 family putative phage cell wall peptidase